MKLPVYQRGYLLVTVIVTMFLVATIATLLNYDSAISANTATGELEAAQADYVVQAAMQHAVWRANQSSCSGYAAPATSLGAHSYSATFSPIFGSPTNIIATGTHASGITRSMGRTDVPVYDLAAPVTGMLILGAEGEDSYVEGDPGHVDHNKGSDNELRTSSAAGSEYRALLRFDLSGLPPTATIQTAVLELYLSSQSSTDVVEAHRLLHDWTEDGVSWNQRDGANSWSTPGGDYDPDVAGSFLADSVGPKSMDITDLAKAWVDGSLPNYGLMLLSPPAAGGGTNKYHSGDKVDEPWPRLTVNYVCECDTPCPGIAVSNNVALSTDGDAVLGGLSFTDVDLATYDAATDTATLFFAGGLTTLDRDIDAVHILENGHFVLSTKDAATLGGLSFNPDDLVEYNPETDTATMYFDGSLHFPEAENIISVHILRSGKLVLSTDSDAVLGGVSFSDKDLVNYDPVSKNTSIFFDGDAAGLTEDITAVHVLENGHIILGAKGNTSLGGLSLTPADLIDYDLTTDSAVMYFVGSALFDDPAEKIISAHIEGDLGPAGYILLVVGDAAAMATKDLDRRGLFESWGYVVTVIDDGAGQAEFDAAAAVNDVVYVSATISDGSLADKLTGSLTPIVNEFYGKLDNFGFSSSTTATVSGDAFVSTEASHYVAEPFGGGAVTHFTSNRIMPIPSGTLAPGLQNVGWTGAFIPAPTLVALDTGAERWDGQPAPARRVHLPFGDADVSQVTADGQTLVKRSLEWAGGAGPQLLPVAHWRLDDASGVTAIDSEGGHDGTLTNDPVWVTGQLGGGLMFDGADDYVDLTSDAELDDVFLGGATVTAWIRPSSWGENGYGRIFDKSSSVSSTGDGWVIRMNKDNSGTINFGQGFSGGRGWWKAPNGSVSLDTWQHVAVVYDAGSTANDPVIYLNGTPVTVTRVDSPSGDVRSDASINLTLGNHPGVTTHTFEGIIDDARIYERMLSEAEVAELATPPPLLPVAHWKMDDGTGLTATDSVGGHDGTLVNGPVWAAGNLDGGLSFDGANDYVNVPHNDALSITDKMSFTAWINTTSFGASYQTILAKDGGGLGSNYYFGTWQDELVFGFFANGLFREVFTNGLSLPTGTWLHLAATFDNATNAVALYANGTLVKSGSLSFDPTTVSADLRMGLSPDGERWGGLLDDVRIYDDILSATDIAELAGSGGGGGGGGAGSCYADDFESNGYSGSTGSLDWTSSWIEFGDDNSPSSGDERVQSESGDLALRVRDNDNSGEGVYRDVDLSGFSSATLTLEYRRHNLDTESDWVAVQVSSDGGDSWNLLGEFHGPGSDDNYQTYSHAIETPLTATTRLRLITSPTMGGTDAVYFDNIEICDQ